MHSGIFRQEVYFNIKRWEQKKIFFQVKIFVSLCEMQILYFDLLWATKQDKRIPSLMCS